MGAWWLPWPGARPLTLIAASIAIYGCVPETGHLPAVWTALALLLATEMVVRRRVPLGLLLTVAGVVAWAGWYGATGRGSAIVGAAFAFWPVVIVWPVAGVRRLAGRAAPGPFGQLVIAGIGALGAVAVARTGGISPRTAPAVVSVAIAAPITFAVAVAAAAFGGSVWGRLDRLG